MWYPGYGRSKPRAVLGAYGLGLLGFWAFGLFGLFGFWGLGFRVVN